MEITHTRSMSASLVFGLVVLIISTGKAVGQPTAPDSFVPVNAVAAASSFSPNGRYVCLFGDPSLSPFQEIKTFLLFDRVTKIYRPASVLPSGEPLPVQTRCFVENTGSLAFFHANLLEADYRNDSVVGVFVRNLNQGRTYTIPVPEGSTGPFEAQQFINGSLAVFSDSTETFFYARLHANGSFASWYNPATSIGFNGYLSDDLSLMSVFESVVGGSYRVSILNSTGDLISAPEVYVFAYITAFSANGRSFIAVNKGNTAVETWTIFRNGSVVVRTGASISSLASEFYASISDDGHILSLGYYDENAATSANTNCSYSEASSTWDCQTRYGRFGAVSSQGEFLHFSFDDYLTYITEPPAFSQPNGAIEPLLRKSCIYDTPILCDLQDNFISVRDLTGNPERPSVATNGNGSVIVWAGVDGSIYVKNIETGRFYNFTWDDGTVFQAKQFSGGFDTFMAPQFSNDGSKLVVGFVSDPRCNGMSFYTAILDLLTEKAVPVLRDDGGCAQERQAFASLAHDGSWLMMRAADIDTTYGLDWLYFLDLVANTSTLVQTSTYGLGDPIDGYMFNNRSAMILVINGGGVWYVDTVTSEKRRLDLDELGTSYSSQFVSPILVSPDERIAVWFSSSSSYRIVSADLVAGGPARLSVDLDYWAERVSNRVIMRCTFDLRFCGVYGGPPNTFGTPIRFSIYDRLTDTLADGLGDRLYLYPTSFWPVLSGDGNRVVFPTAARLTNLDVNPGLDVYSCNRSSIQDCQIASIKSPLPLPPVAPPLAPPVDPPVAPPMAPPVATPLAAPVAPPMAPPVAAPSLQAPSGSSPSPASPAPAPQATLGTLLIVLNGTTAPTQNEIDTICDIVSALFTPALRIPEDITCRLVSGSSRRMAMASFTVAVSATTQSAANSFNVALSNSGFQTQLTNQVATNLPSFSVQSISIQQSPSTAVPVSAPTGSTPSPLSASQPSQSSLTPSTGSATESGGLGGGAIAGIIVGSIIAVVLIAVILFLVLRKRPAAKSTAVVGKTAPAQSLRMDSKPSGSAARKDSSASSESDDDSSDDSSDESQSDEDGSPSGEEVSSQSASGEDGSSSGESASVSSEQESSSEASEEGSSHESAEQSASEESS